MDRFPQSGPYLYAGTWTYKFQVKGRFPYELGLSIFLQLAHATYILSDLERVALDVAFLKDGRIALQGPLDELLEGARRVVGPSGVLDAMTVPGEVRRQRSGDGVTSVVTQGGPGIAALQATPGVRLETLSLEDLFIEVTQ